MEKRLGAVVILILSKWAVSKINFLLSEYSELILGRQGIPLRDRGVNIISLVVEGNMDQINALTGKIGKLEGVEVKSILTKYKENGHDL
ncbi:MAG: iron-only hydrogenase system regulator [Syntrophobacterales bacterium]|nr:iron-only hydrogenase system regulator [Syntrophobacterales bacterium]